VAVNGVLVVDGGRITSARPGRILRGPGYRKPAAR
jgi:N-acyl-D-aspartate/D-glutamate deacylase